jgi:hypothetical protein
MAHRVPVEQQVLIGGVIDKGSARISLLATRLHATTEVERSPRKARWLARLERLTRGTTLAQGGRWACTSCSMASIFKGTAAPPGPNSQRGGRHAVTESQHHASVVPVSVHLDCAQKTPSTLFQR